MAVAQDKKASELTAPVSIAATDVIAGYRPGTGGEPNLDIRMTIEQVRDQVPASGVVTTADAETGRISRTVAETLRERTISLAEWEPDTTGVASSVAAWNAAIVATPVGGKLLVPPGLYFWDSFVSVARDSITIEWMPGAVVEQEYEATNGLNIAGTAPSVYTALTSDAVAGADRFSVTSTSGMSDGAWLFLRSSTVVTGVPNAMQISEGNAATKCGEYRRIIGIVGLTVHIEGALEYTYLTSATAECGVAVMRKRITLINPTFKPRTPIDNVLCRQITAQRTVGLRIYNADIRNTRPLAQTTEGVNSPAAITVSDSIDAKIDESQLHHIAYYGITIGGACRDVTIRRVTGTFCRHVVSLLYATYGEPVDIRVEDSSAERGSLSGFDTHDTGRRIWFTRLSSRFNQDDGIQVRTSEVVLTDCNTEGNLRDGISIETAVTKCKISGGNHLRNGRYGLSNKPGDTQVRGGHYEGNGVLGTAAGILMLEGGLIDGATIIENNARAIEYGSSTSGYLMIRNITAPKSTAQFMFLSIADDANARSGKVTLRDSALINYAYDFCCIPQAGSALAEIQNTSGNTLKLPSSGVMMSGVGTLVSGTATIATTQVRRRAASNGGAGRIFPLYTKIKIDRLSGTFTDTLTVTAVTDATSFVVTSSNGSDAGTFLWTLDH